MKQYLAGGYLDRAMCRKYPQKVHQLMKKHFVDFKAVKKKNLMKKAKVDHRAAEPPSYHSKQSEEGSVPDNEQAQIDAAIRTSLDNQWQLEKVARHRARFGPSAYEDESGSGSTAAEFESRFRTPSIREPTSRGTNHLTSMLGAFDSKKKSSREEKK